MTALSLLSNCAVSIRKIESKDSPTLRAAATATIPEIAVIRDILVVCTEKGLRAFGPSRKSTNPADQNRFYQIVDLAPELRKKVLEQYARVTGDETPWAGVGQ